MVRFGNDGANLVLGTVLPDDELPDSIRQRWLSGQGAGQPLAGRTQLLIVDNFEQVFDAAPVLSHLVMRCPEVALLVTSRRRLRLSEST